MHLLWRHVLPVSAKRSKMYVLSTLLQDNIAIHHEGYIKTLKKYRFIFMCCLKHSLELWINFASVNHKHVLIGFFEEEKHSTDLDLSVLFIINKFYLIVVLFLLNKTSWCTWLLFSLIDTQYCLDNVVLAYKVLSSNEGWRAI